MEEREITIRTLKYGNTAHYEWKTTLFDKTDDMYCNVAKPAIFDGYIQN